MKIYLPTCLAVSALAIFAITASSMEKISSVDQVSSEGLNSKKIDSLSFARNQENYSLDLSLKTNSLSLDVNDAPASDLTVKDTNFGQPNYFVTTPIVKF